MADPLADWRTGAEGSWIDGYCLALVTLSPVITWLSSKKTDGDSMAKLCPGPWITLVGRRLPSFLTEKVKNQYKSPLSRTGTPCGEPSSPVSRTGTPCGEPIDGFPHIPAGNWTYWLSHGRLRSIQLLGSKIDLNNYISAVLQRQNEQTAVILDMISGN